LFLARGPVGLSDQAISSFWLRFSCRFTGKIFPLRTSLSCNEQTPGRMLADTRKGVDSTRGTAPDIFGRLHAGAYPQVSWQSFVPMQGTPLCLHGPGWNHEN